MDRVELSSRVPMKDRTVAKPCVVVKMARSSKASSEKQKAEKALPSGVARAGTEAQK